jgi:hypothetical protein
MRRVWLQPPVALPVNLHVYHPSLHKTRCVGVGGDYAGTLHGRGRHGDCFHTDVREPWRAPCTYRARRNRYSVLAGSVLALLLRREDQRRQQEDRGGVSGLNRVRTLPGSARKSQERNGLSAAYQRQY